LSQWIVDKYWCACTRPVFLIAENRYSDRPYKP
jgi:hypothetical protein